MKQNILLLVFFLLPAVYLDAQCRDCFKKEADWRFAAGVTLYSNNHYVSESDILERQPLEFNFRYKLNGRHVIRLSLPMAWKVNTDAGLLHQLPSYDMDESMDNKAEAYWDALKHDDAYAIYEKVLNSYYNLVGVSVGYDYDFSLGAGFSVFGGIDLTYYYYYRYIDHFQIHYSELDDNNTSNLMYVDFIERAGECNVFLTKPQLGVRYRFQHLLFEGSLGYSYAFYRNQFGYIKTQSHTSDKIHESPFQRGPDSFKQIVYQLSLFYTF